MLWDMPDEENHHGSAIIAAAEVEHVGALLPITIVTDEGDEEHCSHQLGLLLSQAGAEHSFTSLLNCGPTDRMLVVLSELKGSLLRKPSPGDYDAVKRIFLKSAGVLWVTRGALIESNRPESNLVTSSARTIRAEKGDSIIDTLDLDAVTPLSGGGGTEDLFRTYDQSCRRASALQRD